MPLLRKLIATTEEEIRGMAEAMRKVWRRLG
jgi:hypothetical protein